MGGGTNPAVALIITGTVEVLDLVIPLITITRKLVVLKMFFEYAHSHNYIQQNYFLLHSFRFKREKQMLDKYNYRNKMG